jgi:hypothetical protein
MEIKLLCACGTKFKFDVEPVHGRMPAPVFCPVCGADDTALANDILREHSGQRAPIRVAAPIAVTAAPAPAAAPTTSGGLRIHRAHASPESGESPPPPLPPPPARARIAYAESESKGKNQWATVLVTVLVIGGVVAGGWKMAVKWYRGMKAVADIATAIGDASSGTSTAYQSNFDYIDGVALFIKHTNHVEVGEACKGLWKEKFKKDLTISQEGEMAQVGTYQLIPAHNGYVRIFGTLEWPPAQYEEVSQHLSQKFNTLVFEVCDNDADGYFHFGVYEQGTRKFHANTEAKRVGRHLEESVKAEGKDWAKAHGYKPDPEIGFNDFYLDDADKITQQMGMKFWDEPEALEIKGLLMRETQ